MPKMIDLFCGRLGIAKVFAARGWECVCVDLVDPPEIPAGCTFYKLDVLSISRLQGWMTGWEFDFGWASSPCEQFSVHGQKHFHPDPPYPDLGIKLFNHTRALLEASRLFYVMENVRAAQQFVGAAENHCGSFHLWGNAVPPLLPQGITKAKWMPKEGRPGNWASSFMGDKKKRRELSATIPPELANCVADYAERLIERG